MAFLYRDEYYNRKSPEVNVAEVIIAKHRNGPVGIFKLRFVKKYGIFCDLPHGNVESEHIKLPKPKQQPVQPPESQPPVPIDDGDIPKEVWEKLLDNGNLPF